MSDMRFSGSIPELYETLLAPVYFEPYARDLASRAAAFAPQRVLETAAGTGRVTRHLMRLLPAGTRIVATDVNPDMVRMGASLAAAPGVTWSVADACALPFDSGAFDLVIVQFGVMLYADKAAALAEAFRVLQPGGRFVFNVWAGLDDNPAARIVDDTLRARFPDDPPDMLRRGPYGWPDPAWWSEQVRNAGFTGNSWGDLPLSAPSTALNLARGMCEGSPLSLAIAERDPGTANEIARASAAALTRHFGPDPFDVPMRAYVFTADR